MREVALFKRLMNIEDIVTLAESPLNMKLILFILSAILLEGCLSTRQGNFIPKEFLYPEDSIGEGKTFVFYNSLGSSLN